jgi:type I restriction enzyme S subunit
MSEQQKLVPKLRFPEFRGAVDWEEGKLISLSSEPLSNGVFNDPNKAGAGYKLINVSDMYIETTIDESRLSLLELSQSEFEGNQVFTGDIFFTRSSLVKSGIAVSNIYLGSSGDVTYDGHLIRFRANIIKVIPLFAHYLFKTSPIRAQLIARGKTATMTTIGQADVASVTLFYPKPDEQKHIADCLSSLDELIAAQVRKVEALKTHKKGLMQQLFPREGEAQPRLRFPEFQGAGEWAAGPLSQFAEINPPREVKSDGVDVSFVPMASVSEDGYLASPQTRNYGLVKKGFTAFRDNDVIVAKITPCFENGKAALVTKLINGIGFGSTEFHVVRANGNCLPAFVFAQIYSDQFRKQGKASMTGSGGQQRVPTMFVENYLLCVPSLVEQKRIADCLSSLDALVSAATQELDTLKTHKKGLMQQLFPQTSNEAAV